MRLCLSTIILLLSWPTWAQQYQYVPFPTDTATWKVADWKNLPNGTLDINSYQYSVNGEDITINGFTYKKLFIKSHTTNSPSLKFGTVFSDEPTKYFGGFREAGKRIYVNFSGDDELFYDFNLDVGDTLPEAFAPDIKTILSTFLYDISGTIRKVYVYDVDPAGLSSFIIEGIGSNRSTFGQYGSLACFAQGDGSSIISFPDSCYKNPLFTLIDPWPTEIHNPRSLSGSVFPCPFNNELHVTKSSASIATLHSMTGQLVLNANLRYNSTIQTAYLPSGIYLLRLADDDGNIIETQKLVKE